MNCVATQTVIGKWENCVCSSQIDLSFNATLLRKLEMADGEGKLHFILKRVIEESQKEKLTTN